MGRVYTVADNIAAFGTAAGDVVEGIPGTNKPFFVHSITIGQQDSETSENLGIRISRMATSGSGGATVAANPLDPGDAADSATWEFANTTDASSTETVLSEDAFNVLSGYQYLPAPENRPFFPSGGASFVVKIIDTPVANFDFQVTVVFEELG